MGKPEDLYLLSTSFGYGFLTRLADMATRNKAGKVLVTVPTGAAVMEPVPVRSLEQDWIACATTEGYLLLTELKEMPQMSRGKGVKIINVPPARLKSGEESMVAIALIQPGEKLTVVAGKRHKTMSAGEVDGYDGERGKRGRKLPRGYQKVEQLGVQFKR
jgi:topoisomerase-4 subunit A